jgi:heme/copper-type cytochrome/quinol oxidase subunit 3
VADQVDQLGFQTAGYHAEPPQLLARNIYVGVRLFAAALVSFFGAFLFSFFYLRELDTGHVWRSASVKPPLGSGIAILACIVVSALLTGVGTWALRRRAEREWRLAAIPAHLLAMAALAIQCVQWADLKFGPGSGPYASVFIGWTGFYAGFGLLSAIYWRQTTLATSIRHRRASAEGEVVSVAGQPGSERGFKASMEFEVSSFAFYWYFLAGVGVVTFVLLYIVA